jgi:hypothetical protein
MAIKKKTSNNAKAWEIGGAITAATIAAAAAAYMLTDQKTKTKAKVWVSKAKMEIAKHAKVAKKMGEKEYNALVDHAVEKYGALENITAGDVMKAGKDLKAQWSQIQKHARTFADSMKTPKSKKAPMKKLATKKTKPAAKKSRI